MYVSDLKHENLSLEEKLHQLYRLNKGKKINLGFRPEYLNLLKALGNPNENLPPVIHVAGTNGKGSTIAFMRSILVEAGYKVHTYTSPHLIRFNERIILAGQPVTDKYLEELIDIAITANNGREVTFFEITTAMAFKAFVENPADILLLEVGLGGRLDCTNVIETASVSIINTVSYDHMEFLGETLPEIAAEKAGIMKHQTPCVIGAQSDQTWHIFEKTAQDKDAPLFRYGSDWFIEDQGVHICFKNGSETHILPKPEMTGVHQIQNAGLAIAALKTLEKRSHFRFTSDSLEDGIKKAFWPARLQKLSGSNTKHEIWLDGGHNVDAANAIVKQAVNWSQSDAKPLHLILAMMDHKDAKTFLKPLLSAISSLTIIEIPNEPNGMSIEILRSQISALAPDLDIKTADSWEDACDKVRSNQTETRILIAGSLYLAGHILKDLENKS